jgi:C4-dicarboxylate transporter, DctQ subunit
MKTLSRLAIGFDYFLVILAYAAGFLTLFIVFAICTEVAARYFFRAPISGITEMSEFALLWVVFLGVAWVLKKGRHVGIDTVLTRLNPGTQRLLNIITSLLGALVAVVLFWYGVTATSMAFNEGTMEQGMFHIQIAYVLVVIPIGSFPLFIQFLRRAYRYWKGVGEIKIEGFL